MTSETPKVVEDDFPVFWEEQTTVPTTSMKTDGFVPPGMEGYYPQEATIQFEGYYHPLMVEQGVEYLQYPLPFTTFSNETSSSSAVTTPQGDSGDYHRNLGWSHNLGMNSLADGGGGEGMDPRTISPLSISSPLQPTISSLSVGAHDTPTQPQHSTLYNEANHPSHHYHHYHRYHQGGMASSAPTAVPSPTRAPISNVGLPVTTSETLIETVQYQYSQRPPSPVPAPEAAPSVEIETWRDERKMEMPRWRGSLDLVDAYERLADYPLRKPESIIPPNLLDAFLKVKPYAIEFEVEFVPEVTPRRRTQQQSTSRQGQRRQKQLVEEDWDDGYSSSGKDKRKRKWKRKGGGKGSRDGAEAYICQFPACGKTITRRSHARDHVAAHVESRPYQCPNNCLQRFLRTADLRRHHKVCRAGTISQLHPDAWSSMGSSVEGTSPQEDPGSPN
ncbi:hypothetical protein FRC14_004740 [Serendipita sp. 396]|nr:hypothetical protein FRC14_004740 [Serendipita sp. 396]KAG8789379.1 hypothetical protein FRC15_009431 [Serendipita sp. 397]KAG8804611.1 hypothetical protein FRC16_006053 [Serendipita sp. 398]KAG8878733.1 hypothetical protein FRC20_006410 [Serendipita sp. 405]